MDEFEAIKAELDKQLSSAPSNVGVAFGEELFYEFKKRGWLTLENFGAVGTSFFVEALPAYSKMHFAFLLWGIGTREFKVGQSIK